MNVLSLIHGDKVHSSLFADVVREAGHTLDEWSLAWGTPAPRPIDDYDAVLVFGGAMHADQDDRHPWLREENVFLQRLITVGVPTLGVCLGAQLLAKAAHARVEAAARPEIGWVEVELTDDAAADAVFAALPERFRAFEWHYYTYEVPAGAVELARSEGCTQAFRLGDAVWGVQFHPEVTAAQVHDWIGEDRAGPFDPDALAAETAERIAEWNDLGRTLCNAFLSAATARTPSAVH